MDSTNMQDDGGETELKRHRIVEGIAAWVRNLGLNGTRFELDKAINAWKSCIIKIAIIGETGSGKSSFVNAMLGFEEEVAKTGPTQTTIELQKFPHPEHSNLEFWDLPGVGTVKFPRKSYLQDIHFEQYDFFILTNQSRFRENDAWLIQQIISRGKKFYFVRTMIDVDLDKDKKGKRKLKKQNHNPEEVIKSIQHECMQNLKEVNVDNPQMFMVDNFCPQLYDFGKLQIQLIKDAPDFKQDAMILSFAAATKDMLDKKLVVLKERLFRTALQAVLGSLIPIPGVGVSVNYSIMQSETAFYQNQMGTGEVSLNEIASKMGITLDKLKEDVHLKAGLVIKTKEAFIHFCKESTTQKDVDVISKIVVPILGGIYAAIRAYPASIAIQKALLNICYEDACCLLDFQLKWFKEKSQ